MRKGYKKIVVDGVEYQYAISLSTSQIFVYLVGVRYVLPLLNIRTGAKPSWRGKHEDGGWGKREVAAIIRACRGLRKRRAAGGFLTHFIPEGKHTALCGHCPSSPRMRKMWYQTSGAGVICKKCLKKVEQNGNKDN